MSRRARAALVAAACLLAACSDDGTSTRDAPATTDASQRPTTGSVDSDADSNGADVVTAPAPLPAGDVRVRLEEVARVDAPTALALRTGTDLAYVAERAGRVRPVDLATGAVGDPIIDISDDVSTEGERGLLGLAFSPDGSRLFLSSTNANGDSRLDAYMMTGDRVDLASQRTLLAIDQPASNHNGGDLKFGPDGMLWYALGDGGGSGDRFGNAQDTDTLLGAILRIDVSSVPQADYSIPDDNPFVNGGGRPEVWLFGVRNPWRFSFDRATGDLWLGDVGQNTVEEIDVLRAPDRGRGANLQWPLREGFRRFDGDAPEGSVDPIFEYGRDDGSCSITGGYVYRGRAIPQLVGAYVFGDFCEGTLRALFTDGDRVVERSLGANAGRGTLASFAEDADGELYTLGLDGRIARVVPA